MHGITIDDEQVIRPASPHWHLVFAKWQKHLDAFVVGPWTTSGYVNWQKDAEILWIQFRLGTFMPHLPTVKLLDTETQLCEDSSRKFWLKSSEWEFPNYDNVDAFIARLVREELIARDPTVNAVLEGHTPPGSSRTIRHRFLQVTGQSQNRIRQVARAQQAMNLLQHGHSIQDAVFQAGYADQPHLTRWFRHFFGYTPGQIVRQLR